MPNNYGPRIVTDGMVMCLDAGNPKSYPGSGTAWIDLSGRGNNLTLYNGPTFSNGVFTFDGTNDYAQNATNILGTGINIPHSLEMWVNFSVIVSTRWWLALIGPYTNGAMHWIGTSATATQFGVFGAGGGVLGSGQQQSPDLLGTNRWLHLVTVFNGSSFNTFINSIGLTPVSATSFNFSNSNLTIAQKYGAESNFNGKISITRMYNRALSAAEVLQNYNATKGRFKL